VDFVANWTHGFEALREYIRQFTPEQVEGITWVPAQQVRRLAKAIGTARSCSILTYTGLEYSNSGVQAIRAVWILQALAGHLDVPGGKLFKMRDRPCAGKGLAGLASQEKHRFSSQRQIASGRCKRIHGRRVPQM